MWQRLTRADLLIRAGCADHRVISDLVARGVGLAFTKVRSPIDQGLPMTCGMTQRPLPVSSIRARSTR